jgi:hypothetical protein
MAEAATSRGTWTVVELSTPTLEGSHSAGRRALPRNLDRGRTLGKVLSKKGNAGPATAGPCGRLAREIRVAFERIQAREERIDGLEKEIAWRTFLHEQPELRDDASQPVDHRLHGLFLVDR